MQRNSFKLLPIVKLRPGFTKNNGKDGMSPATAFFLFFIKLLSMPYPVVCLIGVYIYHSIRLAHWETVRVQGKLRLGGISTAGKSAVNDPAVGDGLLLREL